jgi:FkbM family methyltransferase
LRLRGGKIRNGAGVELFVDPGDPRASLLKLAGGALDARLVELWRQLVDRVQPRVVIDVGANYGEVVFSCRYSPGTTLHLVEANPALVGYLRKTASSVNHGSVHVHLGAASRDQGEVALLVSPASSGLSTVEHRNRPAHARTVTVPAFRIDSEISIASGERCLFKVDVEGHDLAVLDGMTDLLERSGHWAGICEFTGLTESDVDALHQRFAVWLVEWETLRFEPSTPPRMQQLISSHPWNPYLKDVVLCPRGKPGLAL